MPWKECYPMDEKLKFVARLQPAPAKAGGEKMAAVCPRPSPGQASFGISRKTGYKIFERYKEVCIREVEDKIWLVSFMKYDIGFFDEMENRVEPAANQFDVIVLPMSPV